MYTTCPSCNPIGVSTVGSSSVGTSTTGVSTVEVLVSISLSGSSYASQILVNPSKISLLKNTCLNESASWI